MEKKIEILLNSIYKVKEFVKKAASFEGDIDIIKGRYVIDAKSVMGILSLDLLTPLIIIYQNDNEEELNRFEEEMQEFIENSDTKDAC